MVSEDLLAAAQVDPAGSGYNVSRDPKKGSKRIEVGVRSGVRKMNLAPST